jgi:hypothetical protein
MPIEPIDKPETTLNSDVFGLPSTIRTCDLRLRSCKNELKQLVKQ